jgi:hypothetical protein
MTMCSAIYSWTASTIHSRNVLKTEESHHIIRSTAQLDTNVHLIVAQSLSLGLNQEMAYQKSLNYPLAYLKDTITEDHHNPVRTLEERRTYLGCYYLTTMYVYEP